MKKLFVIVGILILGTACNSVQKKEDSRASKMVNKMTSVCQLTPEQASRIQPILENFIKTRVDNKDKYASDQSALRKADSAAKKNYSDTLKKILSPEQFEKLKAFHAQQLMNRQKGKGEDQENGGQE